jgi:type IV secretion system protein VirB8
LVTLMSDPVEQNRYAKVVSAENPKSPQKELGPDAVTEVQIKSITLGANAGSATVRFTRQRRDLRTGAAVYKPQALVATITYSFVEATMPEADRLVNPRGFTVKRYQLDEELQ